MTVGVVEQFSSKAESPSSMESSAKLFRNNLATILIFPESWSASMISVFSDCSETRCLVSGSFDCSRSLIAALRQISIWKNSKRNASCCEFVTKQIRNRITQKIFFITKLLSRGKEKQIFEAFRLLFLCSECTTPSSSPLAMDFLPSWTLHSRECFQFPPWQSHICLKSSMSWWWSKYFNGCRFQG